MTNSMQKCNPPSCLLACVLGLKCSEAEVYYSLLNKGLADVDEIAKAIGKDKTTVYRALQGSSEKGLIVREYRILKNGGYKYLYKLLPIKGLENLILKKVEEILNELKALKSE